MSVSTLYGQISALPPNPGNPAAFNASVWAAFLAEWQNLVEEQIIPLYQVGLAIADALGDPTLRRNVLALRPLNLLFPLVPPANLINFPLFGQIKASWREVPEAAAFCELLAPALAARFGISSAGASPPA